MTLGVRAAVPVLPVQDLDRSLAWYERLGFVVRARFDSYAICDLDGVELHLVTFDVAYPPESLSGAYLRVDDADEVFARWTVLGAPVVAPPEDQSYGVREWATEDPDGNLWRIASSLVAEPAFEPQEEPAAATPPPPAPTDDAAAPTASHHHHDGHHADGHDEASRCEGCGFDLDLLPARALGAEVRDEVHALGRLLEAADDDAVRRHPDAQTWSPLEYGVVHLHYRVVDIEPF